ncbi:MAG: peptide deformylase [Kiritimatiellia bacterium]|nr:peptide deformylase [Lentisphaerota bacterium]
MDVCTYGDPVLRQRAADVVFPDATLGSLTAEMMLTMHRRNGVGLAAPQAGLSRRLFVVDFDVNLDVDSAGGPRLNPDVILPMIFINPVIKRKTGRRTDTEGCLSVPEIWAPVTRAMEIEVAYNDLDGTSCHLTARGFLARVIQHELDHLDGVLFIDRMSAIKKISLAADLKRMRSRTLKAIQEHQRLAQAQAS